MTIRTPVADREDDISNKAIEFLKEGSASRKHFIMTGKAHHNAAHHTHL
jgi:hypothetical protein